MRPSVDFLVYMQTAIYAAYKKTVTDQKLEDIVPTVLHWQVHHASCIVHGAAATDIMLLFCWDKEAGPQSNPESVIILKN